MGGGDPAHKVGTLSGASLCEQSAKPIPSAPGECTIACASSMQPRKRLFGITLRWCIFVYTFPLGCLGVEAKTDCWVQGTYPALHMGYRSMSELFAFDFAAHF